MECCKPCEKHKLPHCEACASPHDEGDDELKRKWRELFAEGRVIDESDPPHFLYELLRSQRASAVREGAQAALEWVKLPPFEGRVNYPKGLPDADELMKITSHIQVVKEGYEAARAEVEANSKWFLENKLNKDE